jgi:orotate phosphoribosyltransferase
MELERLRILLERHARLLGDFTLSSSIRSQYYFDSKRVLLSPQGLRLVGKLLYPVVRDLGAEAVGGLQIGAIPLALAVSYYSANTDNPIPSFIVRTEAKRHGTKDEVAESFPIYQADLDDERRHIPLLSPGRRVVIVDDVVTTGESVDKAVRVVEKAGCVILAVVTLVPRPEAGGVDDATKRWPNYQTFFTCDERGQLSRSKVFEEVVAASVR